MISNYISGRTWAVFILFLITLGVSGQTLDVVLARGSVWKYYNTNVYPDLSWKNAGFDDSTWASGLAPIGFGDPHIQTPIYIGPEGQRYPSILFRGFVVINDPGKYEQLRMRLLRDDGAVIYLNGAQVVADGVTTPSDLNAYAVQNAGPPDETNYFEYALSPAVLQSGTNILAVELHQGEPASGDLGFDLEIVGVLDTTSPTLAQVYPGQNTTVTELTFVEVVFSEPVTGINAEDLLVNGAAASGFMMISPNQYAFNFPQPSNGLVQVAFASGHGITDRTPQSNSFGGGSWTYQLETPTPPEILITEVMAANTGGIRDDDGDRSDWIEIHNPGDAPVNLAGYALSDDWGAFFGWEFPNVTIGARQFMLVWASGKNRKDPSKPLHTDFRLNAEGEYVALIDPSRRVVSALPLPNQSDDISYGRDTADSGTTGYFQSPTPGAANSTSGPGFAVEPTVTLQNGVYTNETLTFSMSAPSGTIRYTVDGSTPLANSPAYSEPITLTNSVILKARTFQTGLLPSPIVSRVVNLLDANVRSNFSTSKLPLVILKRGGTGQIPEACPGVPRTPASVTIIDTQFGLSALNLPPQFIGLAETELRGQTSAGFPKRPYRIELQDEYRNDKPASLLGMPAEADYILQPLYNDKQLMQNFLSLELHEKMGHYTIRRHFVEVFVDTTGGKLSYPADYGGVYLLLEVIETGKNRVKIANLPPAATTEPEITGGYIFKKDKPSCGDRDFGTAGGNGFTGQGFKVHAPRPREVTTEQVAWLRNYLSTFEQKLYAPGWLSATGSNHYSHYIDVDSFVDQHWLVEFTKNIDGYRLNSFFTKDRSGKVQWSPAFDFDLCFGNADYLEAGRTNGWYHPLISENEHVYMRRLINGTTSGTATNGDPVFIQKIVDRWGELRTNVLHVDNILSRVDQLAGLLAEVAVRDNKAYPRWGIDVWPNPSGPPDHVNYAAPTNYALLVAEMKKWIEGRYNWIDGQFVKAPTLSHPGGQIVAGQTVTIQSSSNPTYYTLDGSDPRLPNGNLSPTAQLYTGPITISNNARLFARARQGTGQFSWSPPAVTTYVVATPPLRITEIMYHPRPPYPAGTNDPDQFLEYIEFKNLGPNSLNLRNFRVSGAIELTFGNVVLPPGAYALAVRDPAAFAARYGNTWPVAATYSNKLNNGSARVILEGPMREPILDFEYKDSWYPLTDGHGFSLVVVDEEAAVHRWPHANHWRASGRLDGSPGQPDPPAPLFPQVIVNEALTHADPPDIEAVELRNISGGLADISHWYLSDDFRTPKKFRFSSGTSIDPEGYLVVTAHQFGSSPVPFFFSVLGDEVYLFSANAAGELTGYMHGYQFGSQRNGVTFGRHVTSTAEDHFVRQTTNTLGRANSGPRVGPIVLKEIMYHPPDHYVNGGFWPNREDEYLVLSNQGNTAVPLYNPARSWDPWEISGSIDYEFPPNTSLGAGEQLIVVGFDPAVENSRVNDFRNRFNIPPSVRVLGPWRGTLPDDSGTVRLWQPDRTQIDEDDVRMNVLVEEIKYDSQAPWPYAAAGAGQSLHRRPGPPYANDPLAWRAANPAPGGSSAHGPDPIITTHPTNQVAVASGSVTFHVTASGAPPIAYRWLFNDQLIPGATNRTLTKYGLDQRDAGVYRALALDQNGSAFSQEAYLEVVTGARVVQQPVPAKVQAGQNVSFSVFVTGPHPVTYQWRRNGVPVQGANQATLNLVNVTNTHEGFYDVVVTDQVWTTISSNAFLTILTRPLMLRPAPPLHMSTVRNSLVTLSAETHGTVPMLYRWRRIDAATGRGTVLTNFVEPDRFHFYTFNETNPPGTYIYTLILTNEAYTAANIANTNAFVHVLADGDSDGMPDTWEDENGLDKNNPADAIADNDGDTMINRDEYIAGTNPQDAASYLKIDSISAGPGATLTFGAVSNKTYTIQFTETFPAQSWNKLADMIAQPVNSVRTIYDPESTSSRYYRIQTPTQD